MSIRALGAFAVAVVSQVVVAAQPGLEPDKFTVLVRGSQTFSQARTFDSPTAIARIRYRLVRADERDKPKGRAFAEFDLVVGHRPLTCEDGLGPRKFADLGAEDAAYVGFGTGVDFDPKRGPAGVGRNSTFVIFRELLMIDPPPATIALDNYPVWISHPAIQGGDRLAGTGKGYRFGVEQRAGKLHVKIVVRQKNVELAVDAPLTRCPVIDEVSPKSGPI